MWLCVCVSLRAHCTTQQRRAAPISPSQTYQEVQFHVELRLADGAVVLVPPAQLGVYVVWWFVEVCIYINVCVDPDEIKLWMGGSIVWWFEVYMCVDQETVKVCAITTAAFERTRRGCWGFSAASARAPARRCSPGGPRCAMIHRRVPCASG